MLRLPARLAVQIRVVQLNSRNPLVGALLLVVALALLAFLLTAGMALVAGGALIGGVGYALRRAFGGKAIQAPELGDARFRPLGEEVFPPSPSREIRQLPRDTAE